MRLPILDDQHYCLFWAMITIIVPRLQVATLREPHSTEKVVLADLAPWTGALSVTQSGTRAWLESRRVAYIEVTEEVAIFH